MVSVPHMKFRKLKCLEMEDLEKLLDLDALNRIP